MIPATSSSMPRTTEYAVRSVDGNLVALHVRRNTDDGKKTYYWSTQNADGVMETGLHDTPATSLPLYGSEYLKSWEGEVILCEGERAADALINNGFHAVGTVTGASSIPDARVLNSLRGFTVTLWPDNDDVGRGHMRRIADVLHKLDIKVWVIPVESSSIPKGGDAADLHEAVHMEMTIDERVPYDPVDPADVPKRYGIQDIETMYISEAERLMTARTEGKRSSLLWGFEKLDDILDGLQPGLICLHAPPGVGKSAFALQVAAQVNAPALYVTAEMGVRELVRRIVARVGNIERRRLMSANLSIEDEIEIMRGAMHMVKDLVFIDSAVTPAKPDYISQQVELLKHRDPHGHALVIIDSLHSWVGPLTEDMEDVSEYWGIGYAMKWLRKIVDQYNVPIIFIAERNRASMREGGLSAVAGSRAPEYRSDVVLSMDEPRDDEGNLIETDPLVPHDVNLTVNKNRNGPPGMTIKFLFDGEHQRFTEC